MTMFELDHGVNCTMLVPYTEDDRIDPEALLPMIDWYEKKGCKSLFAMCHSTEMHLLRMEERLTIVRGARDAAEALAKQGRRRMNVIAAGTFSAYPAIDAMADEIRMIRDAGAEAVVLITNRLDPENAGGDTLIRNTEALLKRIPEEIPLGLYETPLPYKRILEDRELKWAVGTGRICFLKDTCCDPDRLLRRLGIVRGSGLELFNANAQTLLMTLQNGAAGYSSVMANIIPQLYVWLCENYARYPEEAKHIQHVACYASFSESLAYPLIAKYVMRREGVPIRINSRMRKTSEFKPYDAFIMDQLLEWTAYEMSLLPGPAACSDSKVQ